ncbi:MAG TPA: class I SAM-dependent methyltransferase [Gammaproteobacteria bacterium]|nr:class I SAM-dependent methyltransferase [Gammaproteobacteria bacterium]
MESARRPNEEQLNLWNGLGGRGWVEAQGTLDRLLQPFEDSLLETAAVRVGSRVLDVGCGTGSTTLGFARRVGAAGRAVGVDISEPMLALARERAARERLPADFIRADAQVHAFEPASFDAIVSRFGVMFFDDPVGAFANLRRSARPGAELRFAAWRSAAENPFMTAAERAAAPLLPALPPRDPNGPGQFAFADRDRVRRILEESGWTQVEIGRSDPVCKLPEPDLTRYLIRVGPIGRALQEADEPTRARIMDAVRPAFAPYVHGGEVSFTAACWMVAARAPAA